MWRDYVLYIIIAFCLIALWLLSPTLRRFIYRIVVGPPNLRIDELPGIMSGYQSFTIERNPQKKMPGAQHSVQAYSDKVSIIYYTTYRGSVLVAETVDISCPDKAGLILTFTHGRLAVLQRIGGREIRLPLLTPDEQRSLDEFMAAVGNCFSKI
jgi:hypothetical protein